MQSSNYPSQITLPFANNAGVGYINTIPTASQIGVTAGAASYNDGFPPLTMLPKAVGGTPPFGQDMNGVLNAITKAMRWNQAGGAYPYNSAFASDSNVSGYPIGAKVISSTGTNYWINTVENNTTNPNSGGDGWLPLDGTAWAAVTMTSSNVTLTSDQYGKYIIILTGVMTTNLNLIFPAITAQWTVVNNCTGAYTITCKTASGTGVAIRSNGYQTAQIIYSDGVNILPLSLNPTHGIVGSAINVSMYVSTASATATLTAGELVVGTALGGLKYQISNLSLSVNLATTGAGGMDTGSAPTSGYVALYVIYNPTSQTSSLLAVNATSAIVPEVYSGANMPAGYTASALVSVWPTNASGRFIVGNQKGRKIQMALLNVLINGTASTLTSLSINGAVPKNAKSVSGYIDFVSNGATGGAIYISADANYVGGQAVGNDAVSGRGVFGNYSIDLITPQTLYYSVAAGTSTSVVIGISAYQF